MTVSPLQALQDITLQSVPLNCSLFISLMQYKCGAVAGQMSDNLGNLLFEAFLINFYSTLCDDIPNEKIN